MGCCVGFGVAWFAVVAPAAPDELTPVAFVRLPIEAIALVVLALTASRRMARRLLAAVVGVLLGLLAIVEVVDLGFVGVLDRPFNPVADAAQLGPALDFAQTSFGPVPTTAAVVGAVLLTGAVLICVPIFVGGLTRAVQRRRRRSAIGVLVLAGLWAVAAMSGVGLGSHEPIATAAAARLVVREAGDVSAALRERHTFDAAVRSDAYGEPKPGDLAGLAGKDVIVAFVESYGRIAVEGAPSQGVRARLAAASSRLQTAGYASRSAYLTSPTFGGVSWLAHATLQSGVWVDSQSKYDQLLSTDHSTLATVFHRGGWRTVGFLPSNRGPWPEGSAYYRFDTIYDSSSLGYAGPPFGFSMMPDQYALAAFQRLELRTGHRPPIMAEIDLASSHGPWAPVPGMLAWDDLGDGKVFGPMHDRAEGYAGLWRHRERVPAAYMASIEYSLTALVEFIERYGNEDLVLVMVGDHQPATIVSGVGGNRDVPISVIARDRRVFSQISSWGWEEGLRPGADAPVWRMDAFRDRFLNAFSSRSGSGAAPPAVRVQQTP